MTIRFLYFATYVACIVIPLLIVGGTEIFTDLRAQIAVAFGIVWACAEASIHPHQFARRWFDLIWVGAAVIGITAAFTSAILEYVRLPEMTTGAGWVAAIGIVIAIGGLIIRYFAIRTLGEFFSHELKISRNHRIVQDGLYRYVRHPSYTGFAMITLGVPLVFGAVQIFIMLLIAVTVPLVIRILLEEQILIDYFGDQYREYQRRTKRLIPFVW